MSIKKPADTSPRAADVSRRELMASGAAVATAMLAATATTAQAGSHALPGRATGKAPSPPFDSMRDWVAALDAHGLLLRFSGVDQDAYDATAIVYQLVDEFGVHGAPAVMFEDIKANGRSFPGPYRC